MKTKFHVLDKDYSPVIKCKITPDFEKTILGEITLKCRTTTAALLGLFCTQMGIRVPDSFSAQSECAGSDKYDENYGKGLAHQKAVYKYHKSMRRKYQVILNLLHHATRDIERLELEHDSKCRSIEQDYEKYYLGKK